jgi:hypothetical protein
LQVQETLEIFLGFFFRAGRWGFGVVMMMSGFLPFLKEVFFLGRRYLGVFGNSISFEDL